MHMQTVGHMLCMAAHSRGLQSLHCGPTGYHSRHRHGSKAGDWQTRQRQPCCLLCNSSHLTESPWSRRHFRRGMLSLGRSRGDMILKALSPCAMWGIPVQALPTALRFA